MARDITVESREGIEKQFNKMLKAVEIFYEASHRGEFMKMRKARNARNALALSIHKDYKIKTQYYCDAAYSEHESKKARFFK